MISHKKVPENIEDITLDWLNFVLNSHGITVVNFKWTGEASGGRGLLGSINRLTLQVSNLNANEHPNLPQTQEISMVVKTLPKDPAIQQYVVSNGMCARELRMYTQVFPEMEFFLMNRCGSDYEKYLFRHPKCYYGAEEGSNDGYKYILLLEDLIASKYSTWTAGYAKDLPWSHASAVIREVALMHALANAFKTTEQFQSFLDKYPFLMDFSQDDPHLAQYLTNGFDVIFRKLLDEKHGPLPAGMIEQLQVLKENAADIVKLLHPIDGTFSSIRHCDLHANNLMFRNNESDAIEASIFDFQACAWSLPMADLSFFLYLNCEPSLFEDETSKVLELYHQVFTEAMIQMKASVVYSLEDMKRDFDRCALFTILHIITGAPGWCYGPGASDETAKRFHHAVTHAYKNELLKFPRTATTSSL